MAEKVAEAPGQIEFRVEDIINITFKWKWVILFFSLTIPIITLLFMLTIKPVYTASCIVTVRSSTPESQTLGVRFFSAREPLDILNEELFIKSIMVLSDVVRELNLNVTFRKEEKVVDLALSLLKGKKTNIDYRDAVSRIYLRDAVSRIYMEESARQGVWLNFYSASEFIVTRVSDNKNIGTGRTGEMFKSDEVTFLIDNFPHKAQDRFFLQQRDVDRVARWLSARVGVKPLGEHRGRRSTLSLEISADSDSPMTSVKLANTIATVYLKRKLEGAGETISQVLRFMDDQMDDLRLRTEASIQDVELYKEKEGLFFIEEAARARLSGISSLDLGANRMALQSSILENLLAQMSLGSEITSKQVMLINVADAPVAAQVANRINTLQLDRKAMERKYTPKHPDMLANEGKLEEAERMLIEALESHVELLQERIRTNRDAVASYGQELGNLNEGLRNLKRLERVSFINERLLTYLMRRNEETKIQRASIIANVRIIRQAVGADLVRPQRERYIFSGILAGLLIGIGISFAFETMDNTLKSPSWVEKELGLPIYGMIPTFDMTRSNLTMVGSVRDRQLNLIMQQDPKSLVAEAYRALRTNIQFASMEKKPKIMLFTSPAPKEGKSTTIANLAVTMANMGSKVLVLDCDLRKPIMHRFFSVPRENGLTDVLSRGVDWKDVVKPTEVENCTVITSGKSPPNPSELLGSGKMKELLRQLSYEFDTIMVDSSPIIPVTDAVSMAPEMDSVFLVFEMGRTTLDAAAMSVNALETVHSKPAGVIINNIRPEHRRAYGYGYGYRYGYGYKYYKYYRYYSYYYSYDEKEMEPKTRFQAFLDKLTGRKDDKDDAA